MMVKYENVSFEINVRSPWRVALVYNNVDHNVIRHENTCRTTFFFFFFLGTTTNRVSKEMPLVKTTG